MGYEGFVNPKPGQPYTLRILLSTLDVVRSQPHPGGQITAGEVRCAAEGAWLIGGLLNEANLTALEEAGFHYIVGAKLRQLPQTEQARILDDSHYQPLGEDSGWRCKPGRSPHVQSRLSGLEDYLQ